MNLVGNCINELTKLEWKILDSLADDEETVALIWEMIKEDFPEVNQKEVADNIFRLYKRGLLKEDNGKNVDLGTIFSGI
jgi:predicted transcriptional regulator